MWGCSELTKTNKKQKQKTAHKLKKIAAPDRGKTRQWRFSDIAIITLLAPIRMITINFGLCNFQRCYCITTIDERQRNCLGMDWTEAVKVKRYWHLFAKDVYTWQFNKYLPFRMHVFIFIDSVNISFNLLNVKTKSLDRLSSYKAMLLGNWVIILSRLKLQETLQNETKKISTRFISKYSQTNVIATCFKANSCESKTIKASSILVKIPLKMQFK